MARIVEHLSVEELEARYRAAQDVMEARHTQAVWLLAQGRGVLEVAGVLAFAPRLAPALRVLPPGDRLRRWVEELAARYNAPSGRSAACPSGGSQAMAPRLWATSGGAMGGQRAC